MTEQNGTRRREPVKPRFLCPFVGWLLEHADAVGINNEAGRPYISIVGAKAVDEGLTPNVVSELSTLLDLSEAEIRHRYEDAGYGTH
ncbi:hypothetical protein ACF1DV_25705 [Streptomyces achromogenes]|uniref:hypothetical protein n=1 Tax=Streptomyces achromogenes TaxID=67255 RepID=UPI0036FD0A2C